MARILAVVQEKIRLMVDEFLLNLRCCPSPVGLLFLWVRSDPQPRYDIATTRIINIFY